MRKYVFDLNLLKIGLQYLLHLYKIEFNTFDTHISCARELVCGPNLFMVP